MAIISETSLVGTWELLIREDVTSAGERRIEPSLGSNPIAYLMYDRTGHFSVQFMCRDRALDPSLDPTSAIGISGFDAYFGRYSTRNDGTVTQELVGALLPANVGKVVTRNFHLAHNELVITLEAQGQNGEAVTRTLRWQRIA